MEKFIKKEKQLCIVIKDVITNETKEIHFLFSGNYISRLIGIIEDSYKLNSMCCFSCKYPLTEENNYITIDINKFSDNLKHDIYSFSFILQSMLHALSTIKIELLVDL